MPWWATAWTVGLLILTLSVRGVDPTGWLGSDDAAYHSAAEQVLKGSTIERLHHHYARMSMIVPIAASLSIFGDSVRAVILPTFLASIACAICVAILGRALWGWWEGLLAATIVSLLPYFHVLSTAAYPDVHVCLWSTGSVLLAIKAVQSTSSRRMKTLLVVSGFALGLAFSAKVFALASSAAVIVLIFQRGREPRTEYPAATQWLKHRRAIALYWLGFGLFLIVEGLFFAYTANDFFFPLHATLTSQSNVPYMRPSGATLIPWSTLVLDRLALFFHPSLSGWGWIGMVFWPVVVIAPFNWRETRPLAAWAIALFVLVAFVPASFKDGIRPYPVFHGRHILAACIPFALLFALIVRRFLVARVTPQTMRRGLVGVLAAVIAMSFFNRNSLDVFADRPTSRVARAITMLLAETPLDGSREIFMTPSMYWRFGILFPAHLRDRMCVAVDEDAPHWWRQVSSDIATRCRSLPAPMQAYLLATPAELAGMPEVWEYGVGLPIEVLTVWRDAQVLTEVIQRADRSLELVVAGAKSQGAAIVVLLGDGSRQPLSLLGRGRGEGKNQGKQRARIPVNEL